MRLFYLSRRESYFKILFGILAFALCFSCSGSRAENERRGANAGANTNASAKDSEAAVSITVGKAVSREVPAVIQATGSLVAQETSDVAPRVAGKVVNV